MFILLICSDFIVQADRNKHKLPPATFSFAKINNKHYYSIT